MSQDTPHLEDFLDSEAPHLTAFIAAAQYFLGLTEYPPHSNYFNDPDDPRGDEMFELCQSTAVGASPPTAWCACLVSACEVLAEIDWKILGPGAGVGSITSYSVDQYGAEWIEGPFFTGEDVYPQTGDLISFVGYDDYGNPTHYGYDHGGHIGIVEFVDDSGVHTIEGNCSDMCQRSGPYAFNNTRINGYVRADWAAMGDDVSQYTGTSGKRSGASKKGSKKKKKKKKGPLYTTRNDRHDMTLRQVGYLDGSYSLSNSSSSVAISVINYTALLGDLYEKFKPESFEEYEDDYETGVNVDTSELEGTIKECVDYLLKSDFSASASAALTGYLYGCTQIQTAYVKDLGEMNGVTQWLQGIAGWPNSRWEWVKDRLGYDNRFNLTGPGQLDCVIDELNDDYPELLDSIQYISLTPQSVQEAVEELVHNYNDYFDTEAAMRRAKDKAAEIYKDLVITKQTYGYAGGKDLRDIDGIPLEPQFTVEVPEDVPQAGIDGNFTSYSYWYHRWAAGTKQREIADNWAYQGFPYDRGSIALVGGYYCFGMAENTFGDVGDIVVVELENGDSFAGILADIKFTGDANYCEWGHYYENGTVNMIEWERICTYDGEVQTEGSSYNIVDGIELGSWAGQNIVRVTNYGSYL